MRISLLAVLCAALLTGACGLAKKNTVSPQIEQHQVAATDLIAIDFISALRQLESLPADLTTVELQIAQQNDPFTQAMHAGLKQAGYGIRWIEHTGSRTLFQYRAVRDSDAGSVNKSTYELAIGDVEMRRSYASDDSRVRPVSPLYVRGADASSVLLDEGIFNASYTDVATGLWQEPLQSAKYTGTLQQRLVPAEPLTSKQLPTASAAPTLKNTSTLQVPADANPLNSAVGKAASGRPISLPLIDLPRAENVFHLGVSNFEDVLTGYNVLTEQVLTFANDSMRLGTRNKQLVEQLVKNFKPQTDLFSVIGCSMGPTKVRGGNAALALGRAGRVVEALRFAGIDDSHILDEGCWAADEALGSLPRRGVVLTLNRRG